MRCFSSIVLLMLFHLMVGECSYIYDNDYWGQDMDDPCSDSVADNSLKCARYSSCTQCAETVSACSCQQDCHYYKDCCSDMEPGSKSGEDITLNKNQLQCKIQTINRFQRTTLMMVDRCPKTSSAKEAHLCSNSTEVLVYGSSSGVIYRNKFCSQCNSESSTALPYEILCDKKPNSLTPPALLYHLLANNGVYVGPNREEKCYLSYIDKDDNNKATYHSCEHDLVSTCAEKHNSELVEKCEQEPKLIVFKEGNLGHTTGPPYRNEWCAKCNGVSRYSCIPPPLFGNSPTYLRGFESLVNTEPLPTDCISSKQAVEDIEQCYSTAPPDVSNANCTKWRKVMEGFTIDNDVLTVTAENLTTTDYTISEGIAYICLEYNGTRYDGSRSGATFILSAILIALSLIGILLQLAIYARFRQLRNIPGLIVVCIISCLFVALVTHFTSLIMTPADKSVGCVAVALIQYFAFISSFFWTNVMAFDVTRMLKSTLYTHGKKLRLIGYNLYAWSAPLILTIAALLVDNYEFDVAPSFGASQCWFSNEMGLLVFFIGPLTILLSINLVLYTVAIVSIAKAARQTKMVNPDMKERLYLAIRLIVVMGLPWILAVPAYFTKHQIWNYLFIIFNASQGVFMFLCFVCSKTVLNLLKKRSGPRQTSLMSSRRTILSTIKLNINNKRPSETSQSQLAVTSSRPSTRDIKYIGDHNHNVN